MSLNPAGSASIDPFYLLREVAEMSNLRHQDQTHLTDQELSRQQESLAGYNSLVMKNFDDAVKSNSGSLPGYDPQSLAEKMSKFKFAKPMVSQKD